MRRLKAGLALFFVALSLEGALADETQVTPSIEVRADYNDNIFFDTTDELSDYVFTITPGIELTRRTERLESNLRVSFPINRYADLDELNEVDQMYSGALRYQWSPRVATSLQAGYIRDSQPERDLLETGLVQGERTRRGLSAGFSGEYSFSEETTAGLFYAYTGARYNDPQYTDSDSHSLNLVFTRDMEKIIANTYGRLSFGGSLYEYSPNDYNSAPYDVENYSAMVGVVHLVSERYSISADVGVRYTRSEFSVSRLQEVAPGESRIVTLTEKSDDLGGVGRLALSYAGESVGATLSASRDIGTSGGIGGTVERTVFAFDADKRITYKLWAHFSAGYYLNDSKDMEGSLSQIDSETWRLSPSLRYEYSRDLRFEASYSFARINDRIDNTEAERNLVFLRIIYKHPLFN